MLHLDQDIGKADVQEASLRRQISMKVLMSEISRGILGEFVFRFRESCSVFVSLLLATLFDVFELS